MDKTTLVLTVARRLHEQLVASSGFDNYTDSSESAVRLVGELYELVEDHEDVLPSVEMLEAVFWEMLESGERF